jgi:hypothetical protein
MASNQEGIKVRAKFSPAMSLHGINGWGKKKLRWPGQWGLLSVRGERVPGYRFGKGELGRGLASSLGRFVTPWPFSCFFSSFLPFLFLLSYFFYIFFKFGPN